MAYVLGYLYADGSVHTSSRGSYFAVTSIDRSSIETIRKLLSSQHSIYEYDPVGITRKKRYCLRIGNKYAYDRLIALGMFPSKSLTLRLPKIPSPYLRSFLRGYFDGDGCVYLYRTKGIRQKLILRKLSVILTCGSRMFLDDLLGVLRNELPLVQTKVYMSSTAYQLRFSTKDSVVLFDYMYGDGGSDLCLQRKYAIFQQYFELKRAQW